MRRIYSHFLFVKIRYNFFSDVTAPFSYVHHFIQNIKFQHLYIYFTREKKWKKKCYLFSSFTWKLTEKPWFLVHQILKPQYTISNRAIGMKHHPNNVDPEFQNPAAIFYSLLQDSTALLEDNTLNYCINCFVFFKLTAWRKNFDILENEMWLKWSFTFRTIQPEVGSRHTHLRRIYDKWLLARLEFRKLVTAF